MKEAKEKVTEMDSENKYFDVRHSEMKEKTAENDWPESKLLANAFILQLGRILRILGICDYLQKFWINSMIVSFGKEDFPFALNRF